MWHCTGRYDFPYVKTGRLVRYRRTDVDAFVEKRMKTRTRIAVRAKFDHDGGPEQAARPASAEWAPFPTNFRILSSS